MKKRAIVLGCGMVGATMARDLAGDDGFTVTVADLSEKNLAKLDSVANISTIAVDLSDSQTLRKTIGDFDIVLGALRSTIGFQTLRTVIEAGKPYCDISFMPEDAWELDDLAKTHGVTAVVDCGVAPGLSNLIAGHECERLDETTLIDICVGGLPKVRRWPYQYKAPFAPADVIEEYTRPARIVVNGAVVIKPALSEPELLDLPHVGTVEAFNTDGLRSLAYTLKVPNMRERTLRYPGHCELMRVLRETGLFDKNEIEVNGAKVRPLDVTSALLFPKWTYEKGEEELTIMRVVVEGRDGGKRVRHTYDLYDETDTETGTSSMSRTTAFPATIVARMIASCELSEPGVHPPERIARHKGLFDHVVSELAGRGVKLSHCVNEV